MGNETRDGRSARGSRSRDVVGGSSGLVTSNGTQRKDGRRGTYSDLQKGETSQSARSRTSGTRSTTTEGVQRRDARRGSFSTLQKGTATQDGRTRSVTNG